MRAEYDAEVRAWSELRAMVDPEAMELQILATMHADRDLTPAEVRALVKKQ